MPESSLNDERLFDADPESGSPALRLSVCTKCGRQAFPCVLLGCEKCGAEDLGEIRVSATGHILASALVSNPNGESFTVASIKLEKGPVIRGLIEGPVEIGCPVKGEIVQMDHVPAIVFRATT